MHLVEWIATGGLLGIFALVYKSTKDNDNKVNRVFQRLDEVKEINKAEFVSQPVCDVKYQGVIKLFDEIKSDVKKILTNGSAK